MQRDVLWIPWLYPIRPLGALKTIHIWAPTRSNDHAPPSTLTHCLSHTTESHGTHVKVERTTWAFLNRLLGNLDIIYQYLPFPHGLQCIDIGVKPTYTHILQGTLSHGGLFWWLRPLRSLSNMWWRERHRRTTHVTTIDSWLEFWAFWLLSKSDKKPSRQRSHHLLVTWCHKRQFRNCRSFFPCISMWTQWKLQSCDSTTQYRFKKKI